MPTVTRSDCTEIDVTERFKITYNEETNAVTGAITLIDVDFNACQGINNRNNDLNAYMGQLYYDGKITNKQWGEAGRIITNGGCKEATRVQYGAMGLKFGYDQDQSTFTFVAGREEMKVDETFGHRAFHAAMFEYSLTAPSNSSATPLDNNPILLRVCPECKQTHKKVYYRRLTPVDNVDLLHCIVHRRDNCDGQNVWKKDFTLHSTYEDAVAGIDEWSCPNDSFNYGAPYDGECSPSGARVRDQWTVLHWSTPPQRQMAFYVNKPQEYAIKEVGADADEDPVRIQSTSTVSEYVSEDVGNDIRIPGKVRLDDNGDIYMTASGANIWHANDNFHYYYEDVEGDFDVTVNVKSFDNIVNSNAKVGIMFRSSLEQDSAYAYALLSGGKGLRFQARSSRGNGSFNAGVFEPNPSRTNVWLRLVKVSTKVEMYWSEEGSDWTFGGSTTLLFPEDRFKVGLALCSHDANSQSEATLADFIVNEYNFPSASPSISAAPTSWDPDFNIGETKENVQVNPMSETQTRVNYYPGAGMDGNTDSFYYHAFQRPSHSPFEVVVSVDYFHASAGAKGGVMIRDTISPSASNAFIGIHPQANTGVIVQSRETEGGDTARHKSLWVPNNKAFVKLFYDGIGNVSSYYKEVEEDPWTAVENGSAKISITGDKVIVGVAVTGGGIDKYVDFRYSNFKIADL
jgi:regulation of enolase protein 1 (concanavalin A-like superfamily)